MTFSIIETEEITRIVNEDTTEMLEFSAEEKDLVAIVLLRLATDFIKEPTKMHQVGMINRETEKVIAASCDSEKMVITIDDRTIIFTTKDAMSIFQTIFGEKDEKDSV